MAGSGKGGSQTTRVQLPKFVEDAAQRAIARGEEVGRIGFVPFTGPDVAAFTPMQEAAFAGTNQAASAFGLPTVSGTGLPEAQGFAGGIRGFSSFPLFEQAQQQLQETRPGQFQAITDFFIDPVTGAAPAAAVPQQGLLSPAPQTFTQPTIKDMLKDGGRGDEQGPVEGPGFSL